MNLAHWRILFPAAILLGATAAPVLAQRPLSAEQRVLFLEQQLAASQAAAIRIEQRLGAMERQLQQLINQNEVGGHRVGVVEAEIGKLRSDVDARLSALERRTTVAQSAEPRAEEAAPPRSKSKPTPQTASAATSASASLPPSSNAISSSDPGEDAYSEGFRLWRDGKYDEAITALRAFTSAFPSHRRVSFANNLIGRALLDDGKPRPAAEALLANYRSNPKGERAPDSLYYLGQALIRLDQPSQACKAFSELESVYGSSIRDDLKSQVDSAKADARCS